jgi:hypothetical protein
MMAETANVGKGQVEQTDIAVGNGVRYRRSQIPQLDRQLRRLVFVALVLSLSGCFHKGFMDDTPQGIPGYRNVGQPSTPTPWYVSPAAAFAATKAPTK